MNDQESDDFRRRGYAVLRNVIPEAALARVEADGNTLVAEQLRRFGTASLGPNHLHENLAALHDRSIDAYLASVRLLAKLVSVMSLYLEPSVQRIAGALGLATPVFQTTPVIHIMSERLRIPGGYYGVDVHQDWPALQSGLDSVTVWIPLFDVDEECFPLEVIPESHLLGLLPGKPAAHVYEIDPAGYAGMEFVGLAVPRGACAVMSTFTVHRSGLNGDDRLRLAFSHRYENVVEPTFIERTYPTAQRRQIKRELITANFPTREQVARIYSLS